MSDQDPPQQPPPGQPQPGQPGQPGQPNPLGTFSQEFKHAPVSARVPERVARGVMSTGVLVLDSPNEFVLDFMQGLARPNQVAARVVLPPAVMEQFVAALRENLNRYESRFGPLPPLPRPQTDRRPTLQEIYDEFKLPEDLMSGTYSNAVMVGHSPSEFFLDFITNFFPTSAVSARVFLAAVQVPRVLDAVATALQRYQQRYRAPIVQVPPAQVPLAHPPEAQAPQGQAPQGQAPPAQPPQSQPPQTPPPTGPTPTPPDAPPQT